MSMTNDTFDTIARTAGGSHRRTMLALGAAGLATALAGTFSASSKKSAAQKARKKCKKKCKKQKESCIEQVTAFCNQQNGLGQQCLDAFLPCCNDCDVSAGVMCAIVAQVVV
jgi:hypothetical protein